VAEEVRDGYSPRQEADRTSTAFSNREKPNEISEHATVHA